MEEDGKSRGRQMSLGIIIIINSDIQNGAFHLLRDRLCPYHEFRIIIIISKVF